MAEFAKVVFGKTSSTIIDYRMCFFGRYARPHLQVDTAGNNRKLNKSVIINLL